MRTIATQKSSKARKAFIDSCAMLIPVVCYALPSLVIFLLLKSTPGWIRSASLLLSPAIFSLVFVLTAGLISRPCHDGIIAGKFKRDTGTLIYGKRRIYGSCWTTVYYCKPVYYLL